MSAACHPVRTLLLSVSGMGSILLAGCAASVIVRTEPGADLGIGKSFFVEKNQEDAVGIELLLRDELSRSGRTAKAGQADEVPEDVDILVRYATTWERNVFKRLLSSLEVRFLDARTEEVVVEARGSRTQARSWPSHMVGAVIQEALEVTNPTQADPGRLPNITPLGAKVATRLFHRANGVGCASRDSYSSAPSRTTISRSTGRSVNRCVVSLAGQ